MDSIFDLEKLFDATDIFTCKSPVGIGFVRFDLDKLERLRNALAQNNVEILIADEEGEEYLDYMQAEAVYSTAEEGGYVLLRDDSSRAAVVEELIHAGQHRRLGFDKEGTAEFLERRVELEIEAQEKLLEIAEKNDWTEQEKVVIRRAKEQWELALNK